MASTEPARQAAAAERVIRHSRTLTAAEREKLVAWGKRWGAIVSEAAKQLREGAK